MTKLNFYLTSLFLVCSTIITGYAFQIVPPVKCDYTDWYKEKEPNCNGCITSVELIEFKGKVLVAFWADNPFCSDAQTVIYNCDGTEFCREGGIQGLTQCSDAGIITDKKLTPNYTVIKTIWDQTTDCEPECCSSYEDFVKRTEAPLLTNTPDLGDCKLQFAITALTACDQVTVHLGDDDGTILGPFKGNFNLTHTYTKPGTYTACMYFTEIDENGEACWEAVNCFEVYADCEPGCVSKCNAANVLNVSTGIDANGTKLGCGKGVIDPFWSLINKPPIQTIGCNDFGLSGTIKDGNAYVMNYENYHENAWANQPGVRTVAPVNGSCKTYFGCNNQPDGNGGYLPYIFERAFCICEDDSIFFDLNICADDRLSIELWDISTSTLITSDPGPFNFKTCADNNWTFGTVLPAGMYALRTHLVNTHGSVLGFSVSGNITSLSNTQSIVQDTLCCENNTINVRKILDYDCDGEFGTGDQIGSGWKFELKNSAGDVVQAAATNASGELFFNNVLAGKYTITEIQQPGWVFGNPSNGTIDITVVPGGYNVVDFYNCPEPVGICCEDEAAFIARTKDITINVEGCDVNVITNALTGCDQVIIDWDDGDPTEGPFTGNINLTHNYTSGTYNICLYFTEFDESGEACWEAVECFEVNVNCCCDDIEALKDRVSYLEEMVILLNAQFDALNKKVAQNVDAGKLHIYPNPSNGNLSLEYVIKENSNNVKLVITNSEGIEVSKSKINCTGNCRSNVKLTGNLSAGIYYCTLYINDTLIDTVPFVYRK